MKNVYDWDKNILEIKDKYKNHYYLELRGGKNQIKGDSGTGKTHLFNLIEKVKKDIKKQSQYNADNILTINELNRDKIGKCQNKLILIDKAELLLTEKQIDYINGDTDNRYLIFSRVPIGIEISPNHQADLVTEDGVTKLRYRYNVKGWC